MTHPLDSSRACVDDALLWGVVFNTTVVVYGVVTAHAGCTANAVTHKALVSHRWGEAHLPNIDTLLLAECGAVQSAVSQLAVTAHEGCTATAVTHVIVANLPKSAGVTGGCRRR